MKKITSFTVDHDLLTPGIYLSRTDGDITTYDLRMRAPNAGDYLDHSAMHSLEHMFATYIRNSQLSDRVIYFGPMGCQTGFYLLIRNADHRQTLETVKHVLKQIAAHEGEVFGNSRAECGNHKTLRLDAAKKESKRYLQILESCPIIDFRYPRT